MFVGDGGLTGGGGGYLKYWHTFFSAQLKLQNVYFMFRLIKKEEVDAAKKIIRQNNFDVCVR